METQKTFAVSQNFMVNLANVDFIKLDGKLIEFKKISGEELGTIIMWEFENPEIATAEYNKLTESIAAYKPTEEARAFRPGFLRGRRI